MSTPSPKPGPPPLPGATRAPEGGADSLLPPEPPPELAPQSGSQAPRSHRNRWLVGIGLLSALLAVSCLLSGVGFGLLYGKHRHAPGPGKSQATGRQAVSQSAGAPMVQRQPVPPPGRNRDSFDEVRLPDGATTEATVEATEMSPAGGSTALPDVAGRLRREAARLIVQVKYEGSSTGGIRVRVYNAFPQGLELLVGQIVEVDGMSGVMQSYDINVKRHLDIAESFVLDLPLQPPADVEKLRFDPQRIDFDDGRTQMFPR